MHCVQAMRPNNVMVTLVITLEMYLIYNYSCKIRGEARTDGEMQCFFVMCA